MVKGGFDDHPATHQLPQKQTTRSRDRSHWEAGDTQISFVGKRVLSGLRTTWTRKQRISNNGITVTPAERAAKLWVPYAPTHFPTQPTGDQLGCLKVFFSKIYLYARTSFQQSVCISSMSWNPAPCPTPQSSSVNSLCLAVNRNISSTLFSGVKD